MKSFRSQKGYALATVFIFSALLCLTAAALLKYSSTEFRLNQRNQLRFQAKNASEAMLEYGAAELMARLQLKQNFTTSELTTNKLTTQNTRKTVLFSTSAPYNNVAPADLNFWASQYTDPLTRKIDAADPGNTFDPLKGQTVSVKTIRMLASATSKVPGLSETQYATQSIEIRDVFLFNYAIFYNITMEFHPGPNMIISGPVHSNSDTYLTSTAGVSLKFLSPVTIAGKFYAKGLADGRPTGQDVYFATNNDGTIDPSKILAINSTTITKPNGTSIGTSYIDSDLAGRSTGGVPFNAVAPQAWNGNLSDSSTGASAQTPPAISAGNSAQAHTMIEPPDTSGSANANLEAQKYSNKAGLYIFQGVANSDKTPPVPVVFSNAADAAAYKAAPDRTAWLTSNQTKILKVPSDLINTNRHMTDFRESATVSTVDIDLGALRTAINTSTAGASTNIKQYNSSTGSYEDWNPDASVTRNGAADIAWNGQVYVEVENPKAGYTANSDVNGTATGTRTSVRFVNGAQVPNRKEATGSATSFDGLTLATNAPVYIVGNLNSQGVNAGTRGGTAVGTETAATIGTPKDGESPVAIVADAINILSTAWLDNTHKVPIGDSTSGNSTRPAASKTEIAAAFITGNVATNSSGSSYSGGVENFPRFLEAWGNSTTFRYRGSMVALFNSTIATGPWSNAKYGAPDRQWGFNQMFKDGRQPPGTPMLRTFRRITYGDLSATQFNALLNTTYLHFTKM